MILKNPYMLLLSLLIIPYILWYVLRLRKSVPTLTMPSTTKYRTLPMSWKRFLVHMPVALRCIAIVLVAVILARPQHRHSWSDSDVEGIDIMLAVDVSTSMLAEDFKPNRVEALKHIAQNFIEKRVNDNIGLTFFAGEAYTQCPLTTDHTVLMNLYAGADDEMAARGVIDDGTAIGDGIMNALLRLRESKSKSKVIILLTDGVNNSGSISPQTAAEIAKQQGVRIYTIGIGTNGMAPYPMGMGHSGTVMVPVEIDEPTMRKVSQETGGQYFRATKNAELVAIYNDIDKMEKTHFTTQQYSRRSEAYMPFAIAVVIVLLAEILLRLFTRKLP